MPQAGLKMELRGEVMSKIMGRFLLCFLWLILLQGLVFPVLIRAGEMIRWEKSLKDAREAASLSGKPILFYFQGEEKEQADKIEDSFYDLGLIALTKNYTCFRVASEEKQELARQYQVKAFPAFVVALSSGRRLTCLDGPREYSPTILSAFLEMTSEVLKAALLENKPRENKKDRKTAKRENIFNADFSGKNAQGNLTVSYPGCFFSDQDDISFHLRVVHPSTSSLEADFPISGEFGKVLLTLKHMTSRSGDFPGWAPVSIMVNGNYLLFHQDIGSDRFSTSEYDITQFCVKGQNTILWQLSTDSRTYYCIKEIRVEIQP
jgi:hypothetical protein